MFFSNATQTQSHFNHQRYPFIDSLTRSVLIDGLGRIILYSLANVPIIKPIFLPGLNELNHKKIAKASIAFTIAAIPSNLVRFYLKNDGNDYQGGFIGGSLKYDLREVFMHYFNINPILAPNIFSKTIVGGFNNMGYEIFGNYRNLFSNSTYVNIIFGISIEAVTGFALTGSSSGLITGATAGLVTSSLSNFVYLPNHNFVKKYYDNLEDFAWQSFNELTIIGEVINGSDL